MITPDIKELVCDYYEAGFSQKEITKLLKMSHNTVRKILIEKGYDTANYRNLPKITRETVIELIKKGYTYEQIAETCDISPSCIPVIARDNNLLFISSKARREKRVEMVNLLKSKGFNKTEIKNTTGIDYKTQTSYTGGHDHE